MNPAMEIGLAAAIAALVSVVGWLLNRAINDLDKNVEALETFRSTHEKESFEWRGELGNRMNKIETANQVNQAQYEEILRRIDGMDKKIDKLDERGRN